MTLPRQVLEGRTLRLSRRCLERRAFLNPGPTVTELLPFLLAVGARRFEIDLHTAVVMPDGYDLVVTDHRGRYPAFLQWLNSLIARGLNRARHRRDTFWDGSQGAVVELADPVAVEQAIADCLARPVAAGAVRHGRDWPGVRLSPEAVLHAPARFDRPRACFAADSRLPEHAHLHVTVPPCCRPDDLQGYARRMAARLAATEESHREACGAQGRRFAGARAVLRRHWNHVVTRTGRGYRRRPLVAASRPELAQEIRARVYAFRRAYQRARAALLAGVQRVVFPCGTYQLARLACVALHPPP